MISVNQLSMSFSGKTLFDKLSFVVNNKDRIGLTGKNGAGKSTLLKIMAGQQSPDSGTIVLTTGDTIGYLPQEMIPDSTKTIIDEALTAFEEAALLEEKIKALEHEIVTRTDYESDAYHTILVQLTDANERYLIIGGANKQAQTEKILLGLGFKHSDFSRSITEFSSGWQMRVELAKILLRNPEVMLLDEPTNHLDIESIEWLETFLQSYQGSVILVSHDRKFLDTVTNRTIEIVLGKIEDYKVSYSEYLIQRAERREVQQNAYDNQQKEIEDIERFIERFRYKASKAKQAQSRLKTLNKMDRIEVDELDKSAISFRFPPAPHSGKVVVNAHDLSKYYGSKHIFSHVDICIERGEKVALVGKNGEGKSTFSKIVVGEIEDAKGECTLGHQVKIGYFAQNQAALLDGDKTVFETLDDIAIGDVRPRIRNILGCFLFSGPDIDKKVKVLSGGEKTRLALAKLLLSPVNLLILDEPTNHLDLISKDILKSALLQYDGSMIIVSHDRDFLEGLTQKVYEFKDTKVKLHIGDVSEFLATRKIEQLNDLNRGKGREKNDAKVVNSIVKIEDTSNLSRDEKKNKDREERKRKNQIERTEEEIASLEKELEKMTQLFAQPNFSDLKMYEVYYEKKALLDKKIEEWELLH